MVVRWRSSGVYQQQTLGTADDVLDADGVHALSYSQAVVAARKVVLQTRSDAIAQKSGPAPTIRSAIEDYIRAREEREIAVQGARGLKRDCRSRLTRHVLSVASIADRTLHTLTAQELRSWRDGLSGNLAPTTRRRLTNDFKAALNRALSIRGSQLPPGFEREIKAGLAVSEPITPSARHLQILTDDQVRKLIAAAVRVDMRDGWNGALHRMVVVLAATGARFSQVARLTVGDVQEARLRVLVPTSRKGRGTKQQSRIAVAVGADTLNTLRPLTDDRKAPDVLLLRPRWKQVGPVRWEKSDAAPWASASDLIRPWRAVVAEAKLPATTVPYALRHSSIVRGLRVGLPTRLVAATHDTSVAMIESHYAAYVVSALEELSSRAVISLTE